MPEDFSKQPQKPLFPSQSGLGFAYRIGIEFISGILVGLLLGYTIDHVLNTRPWGLVVMVLLGASAGLLNIFRILGLWNLSSTRPSIPPMDKKKDG